MNNEQMIVDDWMAGALGNTFNTVSDPEYKRFAEIDLGPAMAELHNDGLTPS